jgi:predicted xylose isomerase-like sugar epimerase
MEHNTHCIFWGMEHQDCPKLSPHAFRAWCKDRGLPVVSVRTALHGSLIARDWVGHHVAECILMR